MEPENKLSEAPHTMRCNPFPGSWPVARRISNAIRNVPNINNNNNGYGNNNPKQ